MAVKTQLGSIKANAGKLLSMDFNNLMSDVLKNEHGFNQEEFNSLKVPLQEAQKNIKFRYENGQLPFMNLPYKIEEAKFYQKIAENYKKKYENIVVLGIGGSALGTKAVFSALKSPTHNYLPNSKRSHPKLFVADNIDPESFSSLLDSIDVRKTLFNVISKSGATAETMSQFMIVYELLRRSLGKNAINDHLLITTDPQDGVLRKIVKSSNIPSLEIPPGVGGRFSVLTAVGLAPLAFAGVNVVEILQGAALAQEESMGALSKNKAYFFAALNWFLNTKKKKSSLVMMSYSDALAPLVDWFGQLWNESLGKKVDLDGKVVESGQTAIKAVGATDQHSQLQLYIDGPKDKVICFLGTENFKFNIAIPSIFDEYEELAYLGGHSMAELLNFERLGTSRALTLAGRPNFSLTVPTINPASIGFLIHMLEIATVVSGALYNIDPLDQPGVELGKKLTYGLMGRSGFDQYKTMYNDGLGIKKKYILS